MAKLKFRRFLSAHALRALGRVPLLPWPPPFSEWPASTNLFEKVAFWTNFLCFWCVSYPPLWVICSIFFFATCNNRPVQVICCAGKRLEITVYKQEDNAAMGILVSALIARWSVWGTYNSFSALICSNGYSTTLPTISLTILQGTLAIKAKHQFLFFEHFPSQQKTVFSWGVDD